MVRLAHVAALRAGHVGGGREEVGDARLGPRLDHQFLPARQDRAIERLVGGARLRRLIGAEVRLDRRLVGADAIDVRVDAQLVDQPLIVELRPARPHERGADQRMRPDFARVGGDQIARVGIAERVGEHRLARRAHRGDRLGCLRDDGGIAAGEAVHVEDDGLHLGIGPGQVERADHVAKPRLLGHLSARQPGEGIGLLGLFDQLALQRHDQRAVGDGGRIRPRGQRREQRGEEEKHEEKDERVLDPDQELPGSPYQLHVAILLRPVSSR